MSNPVGYLIGEHGEFSGLRVSIPATGLLIGRDPSQVNLVVDDLLVSRRHAQIAPHTDGKLYLIDLQSRNGTHVNGRPITAPVALVAGDKVDFGGQGKVLFVFESADTPSATGIANQAFGERFAPVEWKVGDNILGIYEVTGILGQGGMGRVYKAHHKSWNMDLAVKSPLPGLFSEEKAVENFIREAETWVNLNLHPNIVQCHYVRTIGGIPCIFSEYVPGGTLASWIKNRKLTRLDKILDVAIQFAWGLHAAHEQGIVHQDVKPLNVLMTPDGIAKVSDFGLARVKRVTGNNTATTPDNMVTMAGVFTKAYCSPEQARGDKLSRKTDIWSWAASVLEKFTGGIVWENGLQAPEVLKAYRSLLGPKFIVKMPKELAKLLEQCLCAQPDGRPKDMGAIATSLQKIYHDSCRKDYQRPEPKTAEHLADNLNNRALSFLDLGQTEQADQLWQDALRIDPEHLESVYNSGLHQWRSAQTDDWALAMRLRMARAKATPTRTALLSAQVELESGDAEAAIELLKPVDKASGRYPEITALRARAQQYPQDTMLHLQYIRQFIMHISPADAVKSVCLGRDGRSLITSHSTLELWEVDWFDKDATRHCLRTFDVHPGVKAQMEELKIPYGERLRTFEGHTDRVNAICLSNDNRYALSGSEDKTLRLWDVETGHCLQTFEGHTQPVTSNYLSRDNRLALSGSHDDTLRLWEVATGHCLRIFVGHKFGVNSVCLSCDNRYALSGSGDDTVGLWEVATGRCVRTLEDIASVNSVCLSKDSRYALSGGEDRTLSLWEVSTGNLVQIYEGHTARVNSVCLSKDNRYALSGSDDKTVRLWEAATGRCLRTFEGHTSDVSSICLSADDRYVLSGGGDRTVRLWHVPARFDYVAPWEFCRVGVTDNLLAVRKRFEECIQVANRAFSKGNVQKTFGAIKQARALPGHQRETAAFNTWRTLYSCLPKRGFAGGWLEQTFMGHPGRAVSIGLSQGGLYKLTCMGFFDSEVKLWEVGTGRCLRKFDVQTGWVSAVSLSGDCRYALSASGPPFLSSGSKEDNTVRLWEVHTGRCVQIFDGHKSRVNSVCLSADYRYVLSGGHDNTIRLWDAATGRRLRTFEGHKFCVNSVCLSGDNRYVLSGSDDETVRLWEVATGRCLRTFEGHKVGVASVCLTKDTCYVLSGSGSSWGDIRLWEASTGNLVQSFFGHQSSVNSLCLSGDNRYALSGSDDNTVRLWEVATGRCLRTFEGHTEPIDLTWLHGDCRYALSASADKTIQWALDWELEDKQPADWDEGARPYLETFLTLHTPYAAHLPENRNPSEEEITLALTRHGKPAWAEDDFKELLYTLGYAGYGWLRPEGVRRELEKMAATWREPPPLIVS